MTASLRFIFGPLLDPVLMSEVAPAAHFDRIAHLPAHRLGFNGEGQPVAIPDEEHTLWGATFTVPDEQFGKFVSAASGTVTVATAWAVDRSGERYQVHVLSGDDRGRPRDSVVEHMLVGARHWELPAGWVAGLEDLLDPYDF
ncbi:MAG: hypothetical protein WB239_15400 [Acidimicrobiia bacterium]